MTPAETAVPPTHAGTDSDAFTPLAGGRILAGAERLGARTGIESLLLDFLAYLELERGLSRNTLEAYRSDLLQFGEFLDRRELSPARVVHGEVASFLSELDVAPSTLSRKVACLRSFYRYLRREGAIEHDPTADLRGPRKPQRLPRVLTREQVARLLEQPRGTEPLALRDRALLELMYACGLRASEAIGLELSDVDLVDGLLCARGKGSKERIVPIGRQAVTAVPQQQGWRAHAPGPLQDHPGSRAPRRPGGADEPAHAASQLRHTPARGWLRPALAAGDARSRRPGDHAGVHAPVLGAPQAGLLQRAPARLPHGVALTNARHTVDMRR
jgi:integrase